MRLDKYLKVSRLIKRRSVAKEASEDSKVYVNGKVAKPSTTLKINDIIEVHYYKSILKVKVLELNPNAKKNDAEEMYEVISVTQKNESM